jgi:hypothetical protein
MHGHVVTQQYDLRLQLLGIRDYLALALAPGLSRRAS